MTRYTVCRSPMWCHNFPERLQCMQGTRWMLRKSSLNALSVADGQNLSALSHWQVGTASHYERHIPALPTPANLSQSLRIYRQRI